MVEYGLAKIEDSPIKTASFRIVDRLAKITAILLLMAINFEKEILNMFIIF